MAGHPHTHLLLVCCFSPFCPTAFGLSAVLAVRRFPWCFLGVPFCAPCVFWTLLELAGLELARPFRGPLDSRRQGCFCASLLWFLFSPSVVFAATFFLENPSRWSRRRGQERVISPAPRPSEGQGCPSKAEGWSLFVLLLYCFVCLVLGHRDPGALRQERFVCRGCPFRGPWALARLFPAPVFFAGPWARSPTWIARRNWELL